MLIPPREFERLVQAALEDLPPQFAELLENVAVVIENEPSDEDLELLDDSDDELLGIYRGVALPARTHDMLPMLPDQVAFVRGASLCSCRIPPDAVRELLDHQSTKRGR